MEMNKIYDMFYKQNKISFSKDYEEFEKVYEDLKNKLKLKREEINQGGWVQVVITKGE